MEAIYLVMTNYRVEFKNMKNEFLNWNEYPTPMYAYKTLEQATKGIHEFRQEEAKRYSKWLKDENDNSCFIHHQVTLKEINVF